MKGRSWRINCLLVLAACHKLGQDDRVCSLHEFNKSAHVGEGQGRTKAFLNFLCVWTDKKQVFFILYLPQLSVCLDRQEASVLHPLPSSSRNLNKTFLRMTHPSMHLALLQVVCCHTKTGPKLSLVIRIKS